MRKSELHYNLYLTFMLICCHASGKLCLLTKAPSATQSEIRWDLNAILSRALQFVTGSYFVTTKLTKQPLLATICN